MSQDNTTKPTKNVDDVQENSALRSELSRLLAANNYKGKDFIFLDEAARPYRVRFYDAEQKWWLHWWHPEKRWVTLRQTSENDVLKMLRNALKFEHARLYEAGIGFLCSS